MENWTTWPDGWMAQGNRSMTSYIDGKPDWIVECGEISKNMEFVFPYWEELLNEGCRYYVLSWDLYDTGRCKSLFFEDPDMAQAQFELTRDPFGRHRKDEES